MDPAVFPQIGLTPDVSAALQGTEGDPSDLNRYVTDEDPRLSGGGGGTTLPTFIEGNWLKVSGGALVWAPLGTAATRDVPSSGDATAAQVVLGNDSRLGASATLPVKIWTPVRAVTQSSAPGNINLAVPGTLVVDGITLNTGDRVLVRNQTTSSENGIYVYNGAGSAMTRAADAASGVAVTKLDLFPVQDGTVAGPGYWAASTTGTMSTATWAYAVGPLGNYMRRVFFTFGDATNLSYVLTHGLGTREVGFTFRKNSTNDMVVPGVQMTSTTTITVTFSVAPGVNAIKAVVFG